MGAAFAVAGEGVAHLLIGGDGGAVRLDLAGFDPAADAAVAVALPLSALQWPAAMRLSRRLGGSAPPLPASPDRRMLRLVEALRVADALAGGASLRGVARMVAGSHAARDWPGAGEHLKSMARRRVALARRLVAGGARAVLDRSV